MREVDPLASLPSRAVVVVAAGRGLRAGGDRPKQYRRLAGRPVLTWALEAVLAADPQADVVAVVHADDWAEYREAADLVAAPLRARLWEPVTGGATRQASARAGLERLADRPGGPPALVAIHDGARPLLLTQDPRRLLHQAFAGANQHGAAIPALPVTDTIKSVDAADRVIATLERANLRAIQTPQAFRFEAILAAHRQAAAADRSDFSDDGGLAQWAGLAVHAFPGDTENVKLTTPRDFAMAERALASACGDMRVGQGFDVHAFGPGDHVVLGGVKLVHNRGLVGHSDADVLLHALTDAILGGLGEADIGAHFPPTDPQFRLAPSQIFLKDALARLAARRGILAHLDATLVCEAPRIGPYRDAIRANIAAIAGIGLDRVALKATTSERLGFTGRGEGIAALAVATLRLPFAGGEEPNG
jgi:2-C-methyl-D-erythritol 4-phosphate cytidylyltransferase/2-C-methyl-D-erythritol 2,4-cyclodiphosphate synthase